MKPDQAKKTKKDLKQNNQWKKLLIEARRSRQFYKEQIKNHQLKVNQPTDPIKVNAKNETTNDSMNRSVHNIKLIVKDDQRDRHRNNQQNRIINSIDNSLEIDEVINKIQNQITTQINSQPLYVEQELRRRKREEEDKKVICRICFLSVNSDKYSPCLCAGSMKYVHRKCLKEWLQINRSRNCNICYKKYTGLTIVYRYPTVYKWLIKDFATIKQIICALLIIIGSFALYSKRTLEFYLNEFKIYSDQLNLVKLENSIVKLNSIKHLDKQFYLDRDYDLDKRLFKNFKQLPYHLNKIKFSEIKRFNLSMHHLNEFKNAIKDEITNQLSNCIFNVSNSPSSNRFYNSQLHDNLTNSNLFQTNKTETEYDHLKYHHHFSKDNQFIYSVTINVWYLILYLINDLVQILMYLVIMLVFIRYFNKEFIIWRYDNRIAEVKFIDED